jgi:hypothetical protein
MIGQVYIKRQGNGLWTKYFILVDYDNIKNFPSKLFKYWKYKGSLLFHINHKKDKILDLKQEGFHIFIYALKYNLFTIDTEDHKSLINNVMKYGIGNCYFP